MRHAVLDVRNDYFARDIVSLDSMTQVLSHARKNQTYLQDHCFETPRFPLRRHSTWLPCARLRSKPWSLHECLSTPSCLQGFGLLILVLYTQIYTQCQQFSMVCSFVVQNARRPDHQRYHVEHPKQRCRSRFSNHH